jgi:hypothetical protein
MHSVLDHCRWAAQKQLQSRYARESNSQPVVGDHFLRSQLTALVGRIQRMAGRLSLQVYVDGMCM